MRTSSPPLHDHRMFTMLALFVLGSAKFFIMALPKMYPRFRDRLGHIIYQSKMESSDEEKIAFCDDVASKVYKKNVLYLFF